MPRSALEVQLRVEHVCWVPGLSAHDLEDLRENGVVGVARGCGRRRRCGRGRAPPIGRSASAERREDPDRWRSAGEPSSEGSDPASPRRGSASRATRRRGRPHPHRLRAPCRHRNPRRRCVRGARGAFARTRCLEGRPPPSPRARARRASHRLPRPAPRASLEAFRSSGRGRSHRRGRRNRRLHPGALDGTRRRATSGHAARTPGIHRCPLRHRRRRCWRAGSGRSPR